MPSAGRTSMPSTLPLTPWIFQVLVTDLLLVLTIEMVLSPDSAATSAACAEIAPMMTAADTARMALNCIALSLGSQSPDATEGVRTGRLGGCGRAAKINVIRLHPFGAGHGTPMTLAAFRPFRRMHANGAS